MTITHPGRWIALAVLVLIVAAAALFGPDLLAHLIRERSERVFAEACGPRSRITIGKVQLALIPGDVTWTDLRIVQEIDSADTTWTYGRAILIAGVVDSIQVSGLSIWGLLVRKKIDMRSLRIAGPRIELLSSDRQDHAENEDEKDSKDLVHTIRMDSLMIANGTLAWRNVRSGRPGASTKGFDLKATGLSMVVPHANATFELKFTTATTVLDSTEAHFPPLYDLHVARLEMAHPDSLFLLHDISLTSRKGPQEYGAVVKYETDLITFHSDSIGFRGLDIGALLNQRSLQADMARISGTRIVDFRDKTVKDAPFKHKPMPARLLRELPFTICLDSLVVEHLDVEYNEKADVTNAFGQVTFTDINAVTKGICTLHPEEKPVMHLVATARIYETAPVRFDFRTPIFDSTDRFSVTASIGALPFSVFNAMTNDLLLVRTTAGHIGGINYSMEADDDQGRGRVDVEYADLKIRISKRDGSREKAGLKTLITNQLIRSKNLRDSGNFRHGDFTVARKKDRQIFNYLWIGLREGMTETVLPQVLKDVKSVVKGKDVK